MKNKILSAIIALSMAFLACVEVEAAGNSCYNDYQCGYNEFCYHGKYSFKGTCVSK